MRRSLCSVNGKVTESRGHLPPVREVWAPLVRTRSAECGVQRPSGTPLLLRGNDGCCPRRRPKDEGSHFTTWGGWTHPLQAVQQPNGTLVRRPFRRVVSPRDGV